MNSGEESVRGGILVGEIYHPNTRRILINLHKMLDDRIKIDLLTLNDHTPRMLSERYNVVRIDKKMAADPANLRSNFNLCLNYITRFDPDFIMNANKPQTLGVAVSLASRWKSIPGIVRMTGESYKIFTLSRGIKRSISHFLRRLLPAHLSYVMASNVLPVGEKLKDDLLRLGIRPELIQVLPQPFDAREFRDPPETTQRYTRESLSIKPEAQVYLFVGRLSWDKGVDRLEKIIRKVLERNNSVEFLLVGSGPMESSLRQFSDEHVHIISQVPPRDISRIYNLVDGFVFPSRTEGLPNVILEALASGLPTMASPVGEIPNFLENTSEEIQDYVEWILSDDKDPEPFPKELEWDRLLERYRSFFIEFS